MRALDRSSLAPRGMTTEWPRRIAPVASASSKRGIKTEGWHDSTRWAQAVLV